MVVGETLAAADVLGAAFCGLGAMGVVATSPPTPSTPLTLPILLAAVATRPFQIYIALDMLLCLLLALVSRTTMGDRTNLVDLGVCATLGSLTVLSTKSLSGLLTAQGPSVVHSPLVGVLAVVLTGRAIGQVIFLNRALQRFEASRVVPTHFTLFSLSAILGSAILFRDFKAWAQIRVVGFLLACGTTFVGVYILAQPKVKLPASRTTTITTTPTERPSVVPLPDSTTQQPHSLNVLHGSVLSGSSNTSSATNDSTDTQEEPRPMTWPPPRPQLRTTMTDTALARPVLTTSAYKPLSGRQRLPALALSTGHYLLLPFEPPPLEHDPTGGTMAAPRPPDGSHGAEARETHSDLGGHRARSWSVNGWGASLSAGADGAEGIRSVTSA